MENIFSSLGIAKLANFYSLNYFDIGSRGGFQNDLYPIAFAVDAVGFEPDPINFNADVRAQREPILSLIDFGVSDQNGDGKVSKEEEQMFLEFKRKELEDADAMRDAQRNMAWFALAGMLLYPSLVVFAYLMHKSIILILIKQIIYNHMKNFLWELLLLLVPQQTKLIPYG